MGMVEGLFVRGLDLTPHVLELGGFAFFFPLLSLTFPHDAFGYGGGATLFEVRFDSTS